VARGFQQIPGQDFIKTYSLTIQADNLRLTVAIASLNKWNLKQLDIKAVYLNVIFRRKNISENIPLGDKKNYNKNKYWLLKKALYSFKTSW